MAILHRIEGELKIMAKNITEWAAEQEADLAEISSTLDGVAQGVIDLDKKISELQNSPGTISDADQKLLDAIQAKSKALVTKAQAIRTDATDGQAPTVGGPGLVSTPPTNG